MIHGAAEMPAEEIPSLFDRKRTGGVHLQGIENPHRAGQPRQHMMAGVQIPQLGPHDLRPVEQQDPALLHHHHPVGNGEHLLQPVLHQNDGQAQLPIELLQRGR